MADVDNNFRNVALALTVPVVVAFGGGVAMAQEVPVAPDCAVADATKAVTPFQQQMQQVELVLTLSAHSRDQVARLAADSRPPPELCVDNNLPKNYQALYVDDKNIIKFRTTDDDGAPIPLGTFLVVLPHERDHAIRERVAATRVTLTPTPPPTPPDASTRTTIYSPTGDMMHRLIGEGLADFSGAKVAYEIKLSGQCTKNLCVVAAQEIAVDMAKVTIEAADYAKSLQQNPAQPQRAYLQQFFATGRADNWSAYLATSFEDYAKLYGKKDNLVASNLQENNATMKLAADWKMLAANVFTGINDPLFQDMRRDFTTQLSPVDAVMLTALEIAARDPLRRAQGKEYKILPADVRAMVSRVGMEVRNGVCYPSDKFPGLVCGDADGDDDKESLRAAINNYELPRTLKLVYTQAARAKNDKTPAKQQALQK